jgi:7-cyano-7-deazaguanine synthase
VVVRLDHFEQIGGPALIDKRIAAPEGEARMPAGGNEIPPTHVPFRNGHFLALAVSCAKVIKANAVFYRRRREG